MSINKISDKNNINWSIITCLKKNYQETRAVVKRARIGRPQKTSQRENSAIIRLIKKGPAISSNLIKAQMSLKISEDQ